MTDRKLLIETFSSALGIDVFSGMAPQGHRFPFALLTRISAVDSRENLSDPVGIIETSWSLDLYARNYAEIEKFENLVCNAVHSLEGRGFCYSRVDGSSDMSSLEIEGAETEIFRYTIEFTTIKEE